ncbi:hypothetical protein [Desulfonema magnum]|uniref:Uncharacterized protein n=1 Tax=Desulfonema magnum TaxID=45655 RepID=A0A975BK64_9BACT|nr:hypothetical protein [Desulfonema magnum]QTA86930.1 Uncharacterized protein dnm_029560 [Desulfonema magnum]
MREHHTDPKGRKTFRIPEKPNADDIIRQHAEMREKALKDEVSMLAAAERKGMEIRSSSGDIIL